jgi:hypothetical protein
MAVPELGPNEAAPRVGPYSGKARGWWALLCAKTCWDFSPVLSHKNNGKNEGLILKSRTLAEVGIPFFEMSPKQWRKKYSG